MSVKFNPITSSLKYCFVKGVVIPQIHVNETPYSVWVCIHDDGSILTGECGCVWQVCNIRQVNMYLQYCIILKAR